MRIKIGLALAVALLTTAALRADDAADARAIVEKAIKAAGGEAVLAKYKASTAKIKGKINVQGMEVEFTGEMASQNANQQKIVADMEIMGMKLQITQVFDKDKGWTKVNDMLMEMDADKVKDTLEECHSGWVTGLAPLKDKAFTLATAGETQVDGKTALGVKVSFKDRRDITLFFDKESHLLVKSEGRTKDESGQEVNEETLYTGHAGKDFKQPMKMSIKRDGKQYAEIEMTELKPAEKLDDSVFAKP